MNNEKARHPMKGPSGDGCQQASDQCEASRQKYWSELQEHERIERQRDVVKRLEERLQIAEVFIRTLMEHKHDASGALCGPLDPRRHSTQFDMLEKSSYMNRSDMANSDDVYF